jgi:hypothetical protein
LTNKGPNSWATKNYPHLEDQAGCTTDTTLFDGIVCDNSV